MEQDNVTDPGPIEIRPPAAIPSGGRKVFLAGSIEMGLAEPWQDAVSTWFRNRGWTVLNPRRDNWDPTWEQSIDNAQFLEQVGWELDAQDAADLIFMYLDPATKSPISLLELGLYASSRRIVVCCPEGFWRKGNVDIVCRRYGVVCCDNVASALDVCENSTSLE